MTRDEQRRVVIIVMAFTFFLILFCANAKAADRLETLPYGWTCQDVRDAIKVHGKYVAYARALAHGVTPSQITEIRRRCKV